MMSMLRTEVENIVKRKNGKLQFGLTIPQGWRGGDLDLEEENNPVKQYLEIDSTKTEAEEAIVEQKRRNSGFSKTRAKMRKLLRTVTKHALEYGPQILSKIVLKMELADDWTMWTIYYIALRNNQLRFHLFLLFFN